MGLNSDDLRVALMALRDLLAERLADAEPRETAPLARQLREVLTSLDALSEPEEKSGTDDVIDRARRRLAAVPESAGRGA